MFNVVGCAIFAVMYIVLPESMYPYIGMIGGIGVGYSAGYAWQTAFNTFGALSIAAGMPYAVALRIGMNAAGAAIHGCVTRYLKEYILQCRQRMPAWWSKCDYYTLAHFSDKII